MGETLRKGGENMRSRQRQRQTMYFVTVTETADGIDTIQHYGKPTENRLFISETHNLPNHYGSGITPTYGRYIFCYKQSDLFQVGSQVYIDRTPELDSEGNLVTDPVTGYPTVLPDYVIVRLIASRKGRVFQMGVKKMGDDGSQEVGP